MPTNRAEYYKEYARKNRDKLNEYEKSRSERRKIDAEFRRKHSLSCMNSLRKSAINNPEKYIWQRSKNAATARGLEFTIEVTDIKIPTVCPYLGIDLIPGIQSEDNKGKTISLDRIDSSKGYIKGNVQVISHKANVMKNNATVTELLLFAKNILDKHG